MIEKLKRCPFCGEDRASYVNCNVPSDPPNADDGYINCNGCEARSGDILPYKEAIEAWNTRADSALIDTLVESLESIKNSDKTALAQSWVYINPICDKALAEAKKWRGE